MASNLLKPLSDEEMFADEPLTLTDEEMFSIPEDTKKMFASMETSGDVKDDWLQLEEATLKDLQERGKIRKDIEFKDLKDRPQEYDEAASGYIEDLKTTFEIPTDKEAALWSFKPAYYKRYGGDISKIPEDRPGSFGKNARQVMEDRQRNLTQAGYTRPASTAVSPVAGEIKTTLTDEEMNAPEGIPLETTKSIIDVATAGLSLPFTRIPSVADAWKLAHRPEEKLREAGLKIFEGVRKQIPEVLKPVLEPTLFPPVGPTKQLSEYEKQFQDLIMSEIVSLPASPEAWSMVMANVAMRLPQALKADVGDDILRNLGKIAQRRDIKLPTLRGEVFDYVVQKTPLKRLKEFAKMLKNIPGLEAQVAEVPKIEFGKFKGQAGFARVPKIPEARTFSGLVKSMQKATPKLGLDDIAKTLMGAEILKVPFERNPADYLKELVSTGAKIEKDITKTALAKIDHEIARVEKERIIREREEGVEFDVEQLEEELQQDFVKEVNRHLKEAGKPSIVKAQDVKGVIREQTGQKKVNEIIKISEPEALEEQLKKEAFTARIAFKAGIKEQKIYQTEVTMRRKARQEASAETKKLLNTIKNVDTSEMSPDQADPIRDIQDMVDFTKPTTKTFHRLASTRSYLEANPEAELPDYVYEDLMRLERLNRSDMTLDELRSLADAVSHHAHLEKVKNTIRVGQERRQARKVLSDSVSEMRAVPVVKSNIIESQKSKIAKVKHIGELVKDTFGIRHDHYDLVVESLAGPNSTMDKVLYQGVKEGTIKQLEYRQNAYKTFQTDLDMANFMKKHKIKDIGSWLNEKVKTGKFNLTKGERMALYRHSLNANNLRHILDGGIAFKQSDRPFTPHKISPEELKAILAGLDEAEREFSGQAVSNLFENQYSALNDTFYAKNGYVLPKEDNYYPIEVMKAALPKKLEAESILDELKNKWVRVGLRKGMLEHRRKSRLPIYLNNIAYDVNKSIMNSAAYIGLEIPLSNASRLLYDKNFKAQIYNRYGTQTWKEIDKALRDIAGDWQSYTTVEELLLEAKNKLTTAILGINPFVALKQVLSYSLYNVYVKPQYLIQGFVDHASHPLEMIKRHRMYSPEYEERVAGGYSRDVADVFKTGAEKKIYAGRKSIKEKVMGGVKLFDLNAVNPGMQGAVLQVLDEMKTGRFSPEVSTALDIKEEDILGLSPEDKMRLAYKFADYVTERTQPMFSPEHRSSLSRGSSIEKLATQFSSFTNQALNLIRRTWRRAKDTNDPKMYAKLAKVLFLLLGVNSGGVMVIDNIRNRIYGRKERKRFGEAILDSVASYFYFARDLERSVVSKVKRGTFVGYDIGLPVLSAANTMGDIIADGIGMLTEEDTEKRKKRAGKFVDNALSMLLMLNGLPYRTPKKIITGLIGKEKKDTDSILEKYGIKKQTSGKDSVLKKYGL